MNKGRGGGADKVKKGGRLQVGRGGGDVWTISMNVWTTKKW